MLDRIEELKLATPVKGVARVLRLRAHSNVLFATARFMEQEVQFMFIRNETTGFEIVKNLPIGSLIQVEGEIGLAKNGARVVKIQTAQLVFSAQRALPDKWHGVSPEKRYANRVLDLIANGEAFDFMLAVADMSEVIRRSLYEQGFREYNTGILQSYFEGGLAKPFETRLRARDRSMTLSLTSELKLKRLIIAGATSVCEISQSFRNEGIDSEHAPEFTLLEAYRVGATCEDMCTVVERLAQATAKVFENRWSGRIPEDQRSVFLETCHHYTHPFKSVSYSQACEEIIGAPNPLTLDWLINSYPELFQTQMPRFTWTMKCLEQLIVPRIKAPTFLTLMPADLSPLVRRNDHDPTSSNRAFFCAGGACIADIYEDDTDPARIRSSMEEQSLITKRPINTDYLSLLEFGIPPTAGIGMGFNRLFMAFLGFTSLPFNVKETQIFPIH